jgi:hypothetical protein
MTDAERVRERVSFIMDIMREFIEPACEVPVIDHACAEAMLALDNLWAALRDAQK